jgi:hypothetical protein
VVPALHAGAEAAEGDLLRLRRGGGLSAGSHHSQARSRRLHGACDGTGADPGRLLVLPGQRRRDGGEAEETRRVLSNASCGDERTRGRREEYIGRRVVGWGGVFRGRGSPGEWSDLGRWWTVRTADPCLRVVPDRSRRHTALACLCFGGRVNVVVSFLFAGRSVWDGLCLWATDTVAQISERA